MGTYTWELTNYLHGPKTHGNTPITGPLREARARTRGFGWVVAGAWLQCGCGCGYARRSRVHLFYRSSDQTRPPTRGPISRLTSNHPNLRPIIFAHFLSSPSSPTKSCREVRIAAEVVAVRIAEDPFVVVLVEAPLVVVPHLVAAEVAVAVSYPESRAGTCPVWRRHLSRYLLHHTTLTPC